MHKKGTKFYKIKLPIKNFNEADFFSISFFEEIIMISINSNDYPDEETLNQEIEEEEVDVIVEDLEELPEDDDSSKN